MASEPAGPFETRKVWVSTTRPKTLTVSLSPMIVGAAHAWRAFADFDDRTVQVLEPIATFYVFGALMQIGTNLWNDVQDFTKGADTDKRVGQARAVQRGWLRPQDVARATYVVVGLATLLGLALTVTHDWPVSNTHEGGGWPMLVVTLPCAFTAFAYTGLPKPFEQVSIGYPGLRDVG